MTGMLMFGLIFTSPFQSGSSPLLLPEVVNHENYEAMKKESLHGTIYTLKPLYECRLEIHIPLINIQFSYRRYMPSEPFCNFMTENSKK